MTDLFRIAKKLVTKGKGILASDESTATITKRFSEIGVESNEENRRKYRQLLYTTKGIEQFISGVIMYDETIRQKADTGKRFITILEEKGIIPGIKVDEGLKVLPEHDGEKYTLGLDNLPERLKEYVKLGAKFAKWRAVFSVGDKTPSDAVVDINTSDLALYALFCQQAGLVPIIEPEVLIEGNHTINQSAIATTRVLKKLFEKLAMYNVDLKGILLKPNWVHAGLGLNIEPADIEIAKATLSVLKHTVPDEVSGIVFLSGGDTPENSTNHLSAINDLGEDAPWELSFSFGRALQNEALKIWAGKDENIKLAQNALYKRVQKVANASENQ